MAEMSKRRSSKIKCWRLLNLSVIDTRSEIILLHLLEWLLYHYKNLSNLQLDCKEPKKHKDERTNKNKDKKKVEEKPRELRDRYFNNISQDCKKSMQFFIKFPLGALAAARPATPKNQQ